LITVVMKWLPMKRIEGGITGIFILQDSGRSFGFGVRFLTGTITSIIC